MYCFLSEDRYLGIGMKFSKIVEPSSGQVFSPFDGDSLAVCKYSINKGARVVHFSLRHRSLSFETRKSRKWYRSVTCQLGLNVSSTAAFDDVCHGAAVPQGRPCKAKCVVFLSMFQHNVIGFCHKQDSVMRGSAAFVARDGRRTRAITYTGPSKC